MSGHSGGEAFREVRGPQAVTVWAQQVGGVGAAAELWGAVLPSLPHLRYQVYTLIPPLPHRHEQTHSPLPTDTNTHPYSHNTVFSRLLRPHSVFTFTSFLALLSVNLSFATNVKYHIILLHNTSLFYRRNRIVLMQAICRILLIHENLCPNLF